MTGDGETIWSTEEKVTSSKSGVCTISLDFADVDWSLGTYFIKAFVDGESVGASQIKSVPFALIADGVRGVITKKKLIGTWVAVDEGEDHGEKYRTDFVLRLIMMVLFLIVRKVDMKKTMHHTRVLGI